MHKLLLTILFLLSSVASAADDLTLNIRTEDCEGNTGIAAVPVDDIHRTLPYQCKNGNGKKIKQLLVKSKGKTGGYDVHYITEAESRRIDTEIANILESRKKGLERKHTIEINPK